MRKNKKRIVFLIIIFSFIAFFIGQEIYKSSLGPIESNNPKDINILIPESTSTYEIAKILYEEKLIKSPLVFLYEVRFKDGKNNLKAGNYKLSTDMALKEIIKDLTKGKGNQDIIKFTIPEGYEMGQIADTLSREGIVDRKIFMELVGDKSNFEEDYSFLKQLDRGQNLEGFLFPSTYEVFADSSEEEVISKMLEIFEQIYKEDIKSKMNKIDLSLNEIVVLASIVEREGKVEEELPLISAVFHNRIKDGMRLQSCATVQFILGERKENLTNEDTSIDSPFNTYINSGLPPRPIASPGRAALLATLNPAEVDYLFFVLTGEDGSHTFTKTYDEHLNAKSENEIKDDKNE